MARALVAILLLSAVLAVTALAAGPGAPLPPLTLQDQEGRTLALSSLRGRVAVVVYGGRSGAEAHSRWGQRLDAELRRRSVYRAEDAQAERPVRILAVAQMGGIPEVFRPVIRTALRPKVERGHSLWLDWEDRMTQAFGAHEPHSTVLVTDRDGIVRLVLGGPPTESALDTVVALLERLVS